MARGTKFGGVVVAIPPEIIQLDEEQAARLEGLFRTALASVVSAEETGDDEDLSFFPVNTGNMSDFAEAVGGGGGGAAKKGAVKSSKKGPAK